MRNHSPITVHAANDDHSTTTSLRQRLRQMGPWSSSALVHATMLIILVLCKLPLHQAGSLLITAFTGVERGDDQELSFFVDHGNESVAGESQALTADFSTVEASEPTMELTEPELEFPELEPTSDLMASATHALTSPSPAQGSIGEAGSVEEAVDQITGSIQGQLEQGDVLVVWLLDSSLSLQEDRQRIAKRLEGFLTQLSTDGANNSSAHENRLLNAVVTFGRGFREAVTPTQSSKPVLHSIRNASIDKSGQEKVFQAVEKSIGRYRKKWKSQLMIVIWTDESGDDVVRLNTTIERARNAQVTVSVVGRSAVLGDYQALHDWIDPKTKTYQQLPIRNGPDSAMPERLRLGYWFRGPPPAQIRRPGRRFPVWYGNDDLIGLTSSFSPWGLTRLALETGGSFTLFDSDAERAPYDAERMVAYRPTYASLSVYRQELKKHILRRAIHRAVDVTHSENIETPDLMFFGIKSPHPPHIVQPLYFAPNTFRSRLSAARGRILRQIKRYDYQIEKALAHVSDPDDPQQGLDQAYEQESSPRWRAWYELTRGRLLAASVRVEEYRLAMEAIFRRDGLRDTTNGLAVGPSSSMRSEGIYVDRAQEARQLLSRCLQTHADTPWAYLAERELAHGLGIQIRQMEYTPTGALSKQSSSRAPKF